MLENSNPLAPGDESMKLLDNGWAIQLFINEDNKYTAVAIPPSITSTMEEVSEEDEIPIIRAKENWVVEGVTPTAALKILTESVLFGKSRDAEDTGEEEDTPRA